MRIVRLGVVLLAVAFAAIVESSAQAKPDFSGVWVGVDAQAIPQLTVKQDSSTLAFDGGPTYRATISLTDPKLRSSLPMGSLCRLKLRGKARRWW
jgi:hypothetical protein